MVAKKGVQDPKTRLQLLIWGLLRDNNMRILEKRMESTILGFRVMGPMINKPKPSAGWRFSRMHMHLLSGNLRTYSSSGDRCWAPLGEKYAPPPPMHSQKFPTVKPELPPVAAPILLACACQPHQPAGLEGNMGVI